MFTSILNDVATGLTAPQMLLCVGVSLALGLVVAGAYWLGGRASKHLAVALIVLPTIVQTVIMMVNGNVGAGVAVMGAFSLVRFRSVPGSAREISFIFLAMAIGLATGMGYLTFAAVIAVVISAVLWIVSKLPSGNAKKQEKILRVLMPEDLDYTGVFDDIFEKYTHWNTFNASLYPACYRTADNVRKIIFKFYRKHLGRGNSLFSFFGRNA